MAVGQSGSSDAAKGAAPAISFEEAHAELLADRSIQFELPPAPGRAPQTRQVEYNRPSMTVPVGEAGPIATGLFWVVIGLAALGLLYLIISRVAGWSGRSRERDAAPESELDWRPDEAAAHGLLGDADALAAAGRYSEAVHLLLHRSIAEIDRRRPATIRKALTSRDIAGLPAIPPSPAAAFGAIVRAVERSLFGGRPIDEGGWRECRAAFERFAFTREWQA